MEGRSGLESEVEIRQTRQSYCNLRIQIGKSVVNGGDGVR